MGQSHPKETEAVRKGNANRRVVWLIVAPVLALLTTVLLLSQSDLPREGTFMAGIFVLATTLWISEALPLFVTSFLVIGLQALLLANPGAWSALGFESGNSPTLQDVLGAAADPVLVLFLGGFILAQAAVKEGVDRTLSAALLRPFGGRPRWVLLGIMLVTLAFGSWMSNTATTAMMLSLLTPMLLQLPPGEPFRKALVLCVPLAANISGMATPIASPPNAVAIGFLRQAGFKIAFVDWMLVALPLILLLAFIAWAALWKWFAPASPSLKLSYRAEPLTHRGWTVVAIFAITVLLWVTDRWHRLPSAMVAFVPLVGLGVAGILTREDLGAVPWNVLILIAGGISLGTGMQITNLDKVIAGLLPHPEGGGLALLAALVVATIVIGTFMSNTAAANLFLPIGLSAAMASGAEGLHPIQAGLCIALASSMSMALPISTPPNALAYGTGEFTTRELVRTTILISAIAALLIIFGSSFVLRLWGVLD